jgi:hypothetical protein
MAEIASRYRREGELRLIEIRLGAVQQLFNSFDPSPFHEKDLDADAEDYIVGAVRELPLSAPLKLVFYLPPDELAAPAVKTLADSIHNYFDYRHEVAARDLRFLWQDGRYALVVGLAFLSACLLVRQLLFAEGGTVAHIIGEGLLIAGWVAMWRPMEIFLYEWWPLRRRRQIYTKLSTIAVEVRPAHSAGVSPAAKERAAG